MTSRPTSRSGTRRVSQALRRVRRVGDHRIHRGSLRGPGIGRGADRAVPHVGRCRAAADPGARVPGGTRGPAPGRIDRDIGRRGQPVHAERVLVPQLLLLHRHRVPGGDRILDPAAPALRHRRRREEDGDVLDRGHHAHRALSRVRHGRDAGELLAAVLRGRAASAHLPAGAPHGPLDRRSLDLRTSRDARTRC